MQKSNSNTAYDQLHSRYPDLKERVAAHWNQEPCESRAGKSLEDRRQFFEEIDQYRYKLSPFIPDFAEFDVSAGKKVLEIGLGSGSDFIRFARAGALLYGRDLTPAAVQLCDERLKLENLSADLAIGDAENLEFSDNYFDRVYSYGVIHHSPDTQACVREIYRVLKPGGQARIMIYHSRGLSFKYEWLLFCLLKKFQPWRSLRDVVFHHNESLGTKIYSISEVRELFKPFSISKIETVVDSGDLLLFELSPKYKNDRLVQTLKKGAAVVQKLTPFIPKTLGSTMLIRVEKPE